MTLFWQNGVGDFLNEKNPLLKWVTIRRYGQKEGIWCSEEVMESYEAGMWKTITCKLYRPVFFGALF